MRSPLLFGSLTLLMLAFAKPSVGQGIPLPPLSPVAPYGPTLQGPITANDYLNTSRIVDGVAIGGGYVNLQELANSIAAGAPGGASAQQLAAITNQLSGLQRQMTRLNEGIALASALTIIPPNPGDRFSVTIGGSGFNGYGAGGITGSARVGENALAFVGYGRSQRENVVKGGMSFSIH